MENFMSLKFALILLWVWLLHCVAVHGSHGVGEQPLSKIAIHRALYALHDNASIKAQPALLGTKVTLSSFLFMFRKKKKKSLKEWICVSILLLNGIISCWCDGHSSISSVKLLVCPWLTPISHQLL